MQNKYKSLRNTEKYVANRDFDRAIREYKRILETEGEDPAVLNTLGDLLLKNNRKEEAVTRFRRVAEIYEESGFIAKAIAVCNKIGRLKPGEQAILQKLADLNLRRGHRFEAARHLGQLVEMSRKSGAIKEAMAFQMQMLEIDPRNPEFNLQTARLLVETGESRESSSYFINAGRGFLAGKQPEKARECAREALKVDSASREARLLLTDAERILGEKEGTVSIPHEIEEFQETEKAVEESVPEPMGNIDEVDFSDLGLAELEEEEEKIPDVEKEATPETEEFDLTLSPEVDELEAGEEVGHPEPELSAMEEKPVEAPESLPEIPESEPELEEAAATEKGEEIEDLAEILSAFPPAPPVPEESLPGKEPEASVEEAGEDELKSGDLKERLQETDFYLNLDLKDDARRILDGLEEEYPDDSGIRERREQLEKGLPAQPAAAASETDFEIETALDELFEAGSGETGTLDAAETQGQPGGGSGDDPKTQFDLGVAYREMGMFEDAVDKFTEAFNLFEQQENVEESVRCASLLAATNLQLGRYREVVQWADRGLQVSEIKDFERKILEYDRAQAFELLGELKESLRSYRKVFEEDPDFRDVQARISKIELLSD